MKYDNLKQDPLWVKDNNQCTVVAVSLLCDISYPEAFQACKVLGNRKAGRGMPRGICQMVMRDLGFKLTQIKTKRESDYTWKMVEDLYPRKADGSQYTPKSIGQLLPDSGRYLLQFDRHVASYIDGKIEDWTNGRQHRIIGIWKVEEL